MSEIMVKSRLKLLINQRNTARIQAGRPEITIRQLAADAGVPPSVVSGLTSGRAQQVHFRTLDRLCKALECTPGDLLEYVPDAEYPRCVPSTSTGDEAMLTPEGIERIKRSFVVEYRHAGQNFALVSKGTTIGVWPTIEEAEHKRADLISDVAEIVLSFLVESALAGTFTAPLAAE